MISMKPQNIILQLDLAILMDTPIGIGHALFVFDYGMHQNICWVVEIRETSFIKHFYCNDVISCTNYTYGMNMSNINFKYLKSENNNDSSAAEMVKHGNN